MSSPFPKPAAFETNRALFALWTFFWLLMVLVAYEDHRGHAGLQWWEPLLWESSSCLVGTAWLLLQRRITARLQSRLATPLRWFGRQIAWLPLVAISFVVVVYALRHAVYALAGETYEHPGWWYLLFYEGIKLLLFAGLWLGIIFGLESFTSWRHERERLLTMQKYLAESQLARLQSQLQPHFLFNALNTVSSLMQVDVERADRVLSQLADLLRASLQAEARDTSTLRQEMDLLRSYARIMQERFAGRVTLDWSVSDDALDALIPTLLLQPLLENAYKHGVETSSTPVAINVIAKRENERLIVTLRNTGSLAAAPTSGIGLRNCRERLEVLYGSEASLALSNEGSDVLVVLTMPFRTRS